MSRETVEPGTLIAAVAMECKDAIHQISVDPRDIPLAAVSRIASLQFPTPEREREAAAVVQSFQPAIEQTLRNWDRHGLLRIVADMESRARGLAMPIRTPDFEDQVREAANTFLARSWSVEEYRDGLKLFYRDGDLISEVSISWVKLGDRLISRSKIRARFKGYLSNAQLDDMERRENIALRWEQVNGERAARGEQRINPDFSYAP